MNWLPINWELIRNPYNWVVIGLMVVILALSLHLIFSSQPDNQQAS
jgi:hypothetical protein